MKVSVTSCGNCPWVVTSAPAERRCAAPRGPSQPEPPARSVTKAWRFDTSPPAKCPMRPDHVTVVLVVHDMFDDQVAGKACLTCRRCKRSGGLAWLLAKPCSAEGAR